MLGLSCVYGLSWSCFSCHVGLFQLSCWFGLAIFELLLFEVAVFGSAMFESAMFGLAIFESAMSGFVISGFFILGFVISGFYYTVSHSTIT